MLSTKTIKSPILLSRAFLLRGAVSVSGNVGKQNINSDYVSVREQSRIEAGDGGFQIVVNGNTDLKGAAITSSQQAVDEGLNRLTTGTLTTSDIENHANYKGSSVSLGGGYSSSGDGVGTDQQGDAATGAQVPGSTLPSDGNFSVTPPIAIAAKGNSSSTTHSGISGAQITITDEAKQQLQTGETVEERLVSLNTDVLTGQDGSNALTPIFNEQEIKAGFEIVGALQRETGTFLNNRAKEATAAKEALDKELAKPESERDPARLAALQQQVNDSATWAPGGTGRQVLTALAAAAGGNVTGASSQFAQDLVVNYLQQQGAGYIGQLVKDGTLTEGSPLHAALHGVVACAGAAASDQSCGSGALGAATSSLLTNLFVDAPDETAEEKEARRNLLATLVTGIAVAGGADVATSTNSAIFAIDNNWLNTEEARALDQELSECKVSGGDCQSVIEKYIEISNQRGKELVTACSGGGVSCVTWEELIQAASNVANDAQPWQIRLDEKLQDPDAVALVNYLNGIDLKFLQDNITTGDRVLDVIMTPTSWPIIVMGSRNILTNSFTRGKEQLIAVGVSSLASGVIQYGITGEVKLSDVIGAGVIGAITAGKGYNPTVTWNAVGGYYQAEIKGDDPFLGALLSRAGASVGYAAGSVLKIPFDKKFNPISKQYEWVETGIWTITKPVPQNNLPSISGNVSESAFSEGMSGVLQDLIKNKKGGGYVE
ncbi:hypothetical protein E4695_09840 [Alcaligenaceae bacterium 429]|nr:hypothetical protein E4695_09840 [Alcaligenaceae bacterium 429]